MSQISLQVPQVGLPNSTEDVKLVNDMTTIQNAINGGLDATYISAALAQSAVVNQAGQTVKGASAIGASESRTNAVYGTMPTPDQVTGIVLSTNGLIAVSYQATWQESVAGVARAAVFIGANQAVIQGFNGTTRGPQTQAAATNASTAAVNVPLFSSASGLMSVKGTAGFSADATTGQIVGFGTTAGGATDITAQEIGGVVVGSSGASPNGPGGWFLLDNLPAGTYAISVQFKSSSGSVTVSNRRLRVLALSFG